MQTPHTVIVSAIVIIFAVGTGFYWWQSTALTDDNRPEDITTRQSDNMTNSVSTGTLPSFTESAPNSEQAASMAPSAGNGASQNPVPMPEPVTETIPLKETVQAGATFTVKVAEKTAQHPEFGRGDSDGYVVDGTQGKELELRRGAQYIFTVDGGSDHPFYLSTSSIGDGEGSLTSSVLQGTLTFTPTATTPDIIYYQCAAHEYMGWRMRIID